MKRYVLRSTLLHANKTTKNKMLSILKTTDLFINTNQAFTTTLNFTPINLATSYMYNYRMIHTMLTNINFICTSLETGRNANLL